MKPGVVVAILIVSTTAALFVEGRSLSQFSATASAAEACAFGPGVDRWDIKTSVRQNGHRPATISVGALIGAQNISKPSGDLSRKGQLDNWVAHDPRFVSALHQQQKYLTIHRTMSGSAIDAVDRIFENYGLSFKGYIKDPIQLDGHVHHEGDMVSVRGVIFAMKCEGSGAHPDGDFHADFMSNSTGQGKCAIVEVPRPVWIRDHNLRSQVELARQKFVALSTSLPVSVTITGQLFYDLSHSPTVPQRGHGFCAHTLWEIHPVTSVSPSEG